MVRTQRLPGTEEKGVNSRSELLMKTLDFRLIFFFFLSNVNQKSVFSPIETALKTKIKSKFEGVNDTVFELMKPFLCWDLAASTFLHRHSS